MLNLYDLTVEYKTNPLGMDEVQPRFSWKLRSDTPDTVQTAYQIRVSNGEVLWDTGRVESDQSILVEYLGAAFAPRTPYTWQVTVWTNHGESAAAGAAFETGLLGGSAFEGKAQWITDGLPADETASPIFTKRFTPAKPVRSARLYATALGLYETELNGEKLDDAYFTPGWTSYRKRLQYQTYAVKNIVAGENELRFTLGNGWYKGYLGFTPTPNAHVS